MSQPDDFDVDLGAYFQAVARLWWLVVLLAVVGALAGYGIAKVATRTYSATATVYLGQPTDANGNAVNSVPSNPRAAEQIASGSAVLSQVVAQLHGEIKLGALRRGLTVTVPASAIKSTTTPSNIVSVIVVSRSRKKAADAANAVAQLLVSRLGAYPDAKIALFEQQIAATQAQLAATSARLAAAQRQLAASGGGAAAPRIWPSSSRPRPSSRPCRRRCRPTSCRCSWRATSSRPPWSAPPSPRVPPRTRRPPGPARPAALWPASWWRSS